MNASLRANHIGPYLIQSQIGSGSYAEVLKVRHIRGSVDLAMKIYSKSDLANPDILNHYTKELAILSKVHHPFIVEVFDLVETDDYKAIVMELVDGGNLLDYSNNHHLSIDEVQRIFGQLVSTLNYLHRSRICHGDIKLENILLDRNLNIRLIDFGFAEELTPDQPWMSDTRGSPAYIAPEILRNEKYTSSVDVWSLGVLLYVLCVGHLPFLGPSVVEQLQCVLTLDPQIPLSVCPHAASLLRQMLQKDPYKRITMQDVQSDPWVREGANAAEQLVELQRRVYLMCENVLCSYDRALFCAIRRAKLVDAMAGRLNLLWHSNENENENEIGPRVSKPLLKSVLRQRHRPSLRSPMPCYTFG